MKRVQLVALGLAVAAFLIACGGGGSENFEDPHDDPDLDPPDNGPAPGQSPWVKAVCTPEEAASGYACRMIVSGTRAE